MKEIILNKKSYNIPESWYDITIKHFQEIYNGNKEEEDETITKLNKQFRTLSLYTSIPVDELKHGNIKEVSEISNYLTFITEEIPSKQITEFEHNGIKYNVVQGLSKQQFQDYVSLENVLQHSNRIDQLHYILAILARKSPEETLDDYDVDERAKEFLSVDIVTAHNVSLFFSALGKVYNTHGTIYSNPQKLIKMKSKEVQESFSTMQVGKGWFMNFVIGIMKRWITYLEKRAMKYFQSSQQERSNQTLSTKNVFVRMLKKVVKQKK